MILKSGSGTEGAVRGWLNELTTALIRDGLNARAVPTADPPFLRAFNPSTEHGQNVYISEHEGALWWHWGQGPVRPATDIDGTVARIREALSMRTAPSQLS